MSRMAERTEGPLGETGAQPRAAMGFCVSHAPQIFLGPPEEDPAELSRVHDGYRLFAKRANQLNLDALCVVVLDHLTITFSTWSQRSPCSPGTPSWHSSTGYG